MGGLGGEVWSGGRRHQKRNRQFSAKGLLRNIGVKLFKPNSRFRRKSDEAVCICIPVCIISDDHTEVKSIVTKIFDAFLNVQCKGEMCVETDKYCDISL